VAVTGKCVVFASSLALPTGVVCKQKYHAMRKFRGEGEHASVPLPHSWLRQCKHVAWQ